MLTQRQKDLLEIIIKEFIETADAVGSIDLPQKYELHVSPATIRNEMARLVDLGYLEKPHASSGRVPTTRAFRYFLDDIMDALEELDIRKKVVFDEDLFQKRYNIDHLMIGALKALNELTDNACVALVDDKIYHIGLDDLLVNPEFQDILQLRNLLSILEDYSELADILSKYRGSRNIGVLIGDEIGRKSLEQGAIVFATISTFSDRDGYIAVVGPSRMNYRKVIPALKHVAAKISEVLGGWHT